FNSSVNGIEFGAFGAQIVDEFDNHHIRFELRHLTVKLVDAFGCASSADAEIFGDKPMLLKALTQSFFSQTGEAEFRRACVGSCSHAVSPEHDAHRLMCLQLSDSFCQRLQILRAIGK